jgi:hypothetical protein
MASVISACLLLLLSVIWLGAGRKEPEIVDDR